MNTRGGFGCWGFLALLLIFVIFFIALSIATAVMYAIGLMLAILYRYLFNPQPRLFNATPISRWTSAYEQASFFLYDRLHIDVTTTPLRVLVGCVLISMVPMMGLQVLFLGVGLQSCWLLPVVGTIVGFITAHNMTQPRAGLFPLNLYIGGLEGVLPEEDYYLLPKE